MGLISMRKVIIATCWIIVLFSLLTIPTLIPIGEQNLMEWQRDIFIWNYFGVSANYVLFVIYFFYSKKRKETFGLHFGKWKDHALSYVIILVSIIVFFRIVTFIAEGPLVLQIPPLTTILFQLIFVAFGEELFWRGFIQSKFGFWIATIGFGLLHFIPTYVINVFIYNTDFDVLNGLAVMSFALIMGLILGLIRKKTDSVYASTLLHGMYGLSNYVIVPIVV